MAQTDSLDLNETSSLNNYAICAYCGNKFATKTALVPHVKTCVYNRTCNFCDKTFKNRGILVHHSRQRHGKYGNVLKGSQVFPCIACTGTYKHAFVLRHHIRDMHYNMVAMVTEGETRKINDVWYERVLNSDELVQITKTGPNSYLMKRTKDLGYATCSQKDPVDLSSLYPTRQYRKKSYCKICRKTFMMDIKTHMKTKHPDVDVDHVFAHLWDIWNKQNQNDAVSGRSGNSVHICAMCRCVLQKLIRFVRQCVLAQKILRESISQDIRYNRPSLFLSLVSTPPNVLYVGPDQVSIKSEEEVDGSDEDNTPLVTLGKNGDTYDAVPGDGGADDIRYNHLIPFPSLASTPPDVFYVGSDQVTIKSEEVDGFGSDEDDVPLVKLGKNGDAYDDVPGDEGGDDKTPEIKSEPAPELNGHKKKREKKRSRKKKELREGFTSRMVQETDEYLVIKLSKEQVLQEMAENATSARYVAAPYKCEKCVKGFNFEDVLETHMAKHSPDIGKFQCELCTQYCASAVSLRGHMKSHTTRYKCKVCGLVRLSRQHIVEHHGIAHTAAATAYTCDKCGFTTNKRTVIQNHVRRHAAREPHACHRCGKLYKNLETLRIHVMRHDKKRHTCAQCKLQFAYAAQLGAHVRGVHERRDFYCVECDVLFKSSDTLKIHFQRAKRHRDESSYKYACPECPQRFISRSALGGHARARHEAARLPCRTCGQLSSRKNLLSLQTHAHTGERPNVCACEASVEKPASVSIRAQKTARHKNSEEESNQAESITALQNEKIIK